MYVGSSSAPSNVLNCRWKRGFTSRFNVLNIIFVVYLVLLIQQRHAVSISALLASTGTLELSKNRLENRSLGRRNDFSQTRRRGVVVQFFEQPPSPTPTFAKFLMSLKSSSWQCWKTLFCVLPVIVESGTPEKSTHCDLCHWFPLLVNL